jgi:hypothetical protein
MEQVGPVHEDEATSLDAVEKVHLALMKWSSATLRHATQSRKCSNVMGNAIGGTPLGGACGDQ